MDNNDILQKFGNNYRVNDKTFKLGIAQKFAEHIAKRFVDRIVLETCTGGGFTTIEIAKCARHVYTVEIDESRYRDAIYNSKVANVENRINFINNSIWEIQLHEFDYKIDSAFIDPDWNDWNQKRNYHFQNSTTIPPSDKLFSNIYNYTKNITLVQPPFIDDSEYIDLPAHETEKLFMDNEYCLCCLHFGALAQNYKITEYKI